MGDSKVIGRSKGPWVKWSWRTPVPGIPGPQVYQPPHADMSPEALAAHVTAADPFPDWTHETTIVVRVPIDRFPSARAAMSYFQSIHGRLFQNLSTAKYWAARVARV